MSSPNMTGGVTMVTQQQTIVSGKGQGKQPQLLPKPVQLATHSQQQQQQQQQLQQQQQQQTRLLAPTATVTCGSQFVLNAGNVLTSFSGAQGGATNAPLLLGQMVGSAGTNNTPILIQVRYVKC